MQQNFSFFYLENLGVAKIHYWRPKSQFENRVLAELKVAESQRTECTRFVLVSNEYMLPPSPFGYFYRRFSN